MRLTKLKLSGFKSFVDPTTVVFPGQLAGVVGPNGCGKSNIIDAVRWVLGESKASELRGESIQDVIFKGSGTRKEVSRANVELYFDNAQGRAAGQWSQYAEITVKRVLDREGNSSYYINNLHVRRRDVIDLFLGTGLGPRAYAIIGQGMISRIVEAKPEELRFFLEEAAGVTKYKERRKETENRLEDARENIARVDDIRNELEGQITRLQSQAEIAARYRDLHDNLSQRQNLLWLKKRNDARNESCRSAGEIDKSELSLEAQVAQLREAEAGVERARETHFASSDALHAAQAELYSATAEVTRLESEIGHLRDSRQRLELRMSQLAVEDTHWQAQRAELTGDASRWQSLLENARMRAATAQARHAEVAQRLPEAEAAVQGAGGAVAEARRSLAEAEQGRRLAEADRGHALRAIENLTQRRARLEQERTQHSPPDPALHANAVEAQAQADEQLANQQGRLAELQGRLPLLEAELRTARERLQAAHRQATEARARRDALQQLQQRVQQSGDLAEWLKQHGLADARPLWKSIHVEAGWETAVESMLRERLAAFITDSSIVDRLLDNPPPKTVALAWEGPAAAVLGDSSLRAKVRCDDPKLANALDAWLGEIAAVESLAEAGTAQSAVDPAGHLRTAHGLVLYVPDAQMHGLIERQREIEELEAVIDTRIEEEDEARERQAEAERRLSDVQAELSQLRRTVQEAQQRAHAAQLDALKLTQAKARFEERTAQITRDLEDILRAEEAERDAQARADEAAAAWHDSIESARSRLDEALGLQRDKDVSLRETRALEQQLSREAQEAAFSERECLGKLEDNSRAAVTARTQLERISNETMAVREELAGISDSILQEQLQSSLSARQSREALLSERRNTLETAASELRLLDETRLKLEQSINPLRERINGLKLKHQASQLNEQQFQDRLVEAGIASEEAETALAQALVPGLRDSVLQSEITHLSGEIEALGSVNLAALDELNSAQERKGYLDAQSADLNEAIQTLENAIRRIDRETREQLQETFDSVNHHFGALFPQLFGGGEAKLLLTGEEILDSGVQIMAHPPGKKNSTIHLLSGGEKALTAIALVFAMFQLNPAPFCLLDEVDAPLDDSNTERFCDMVRRMSQHTQFVFISHNKIAMEMAHQLIGVTMQERGVSRVVEVDMEEALRMTEEQAA